MALIWNITFPNGVFSSADTLILKSKVKNAHVRETTNLLLVGHELNLKPDPRMKGFSTCFIHMALFLAWRVLFHATCYERVTPFGLCNAPMTFERLMRILLGDYCRFRLAGLTFNAQNYKSFPFKVKFMTTRDLIRCSQD